MKSTWKTRTSQTEQATSFEERIALADRRQKRIGSTHYTRTLLRAALTGTWRGTAQKPTPSFRGSPNLYIPNYSLEPILTLSHDLYIFERTCAREGNGGVQSVGFDASYKQQGHVDGFRKDKELGALAIVPIDSSCLSKHNNCHRPNRTCIASFRYSGWKVVVMRRGRSLPELRITKAVEPQPAYYGY